MTTLTNEDPADPSVHEQPEPDAPAAEDALRWRDASETTPIAGARVVVAFADGEVNALHHGAAIWPRIARWRPLPIPAGDAAIAAELERLRAEVERLKGTSVELFDEARHSQQKRFAAEVERDEARAERDALRATLDDAGMLLRRCAMRLRARGDDESAECVLDYCARTGLQGNPLRTAPPAEDGAAAAA